MIDPRVIHAAKTAFQYFEAVHRSILANMIRDRLGCTAPEAERLVDELACEHYIKIDAGPNPRIRIGRALGFDTPREPLVRNPPLPQG